MQRMVMKNIAWITYVLLSLFVIEGVAAEPRVRFWGEVPFFEAGNYREFESTITKTRAEARQQLLAEFGSMYFPSVMYGSEAGRAAQAILKVLMSLDRLRDEHLSRANQGIPESLERQLIASFEQLYRNNGLTEEERRAEFVRFNGWNEALSKLRRGQVTTPERDRIFSEIFNQVDYVLYGSYTVIDNGHVSLSLTAERFHTGEMRTFQARGRIQEAVSALAVELFDFAQANRRSAWKNPLEGLTWLVPPISLQGTQLAREAKLFCEGQGARVPFARELVLAAQGGAYRNGGVNEIRHDDVYLVADVQRDLENHFYFGVSLTGDDPRGPVRTAAGLGTVRPQFVCVKGEVAELVRWEQDLYRAVRKAQQLSVATRVRVIDALEYLLLRLDAYGHSGYLVENKFQSTAQAVEILRQQKVVISDSLRQRLESLE